jgi:hypothetical protein
LKKKSVFGSNTTKSKMDNKWKDGSNDDRNRHISQMNGIHTKHEHDDSKIAFLIRAKVQVDY